MLDDETKLIHKTQAGLADYDSYKCTRSVFDDLKNESKYVILRQILSENNIDVLYGDNDNYFDNLDLWIKKID
jgi:hypothetical protein